VVQEERVQCIFIVINIRRKADLTGEMGVEEVI
jgi:hypothetical protein